MGIVAGEGIPVELSPSNIPQRQVARERYPQGHVARESTEFSPGKVYNVVVFTLDAAKELAIPEVLFWTISACGFLVMHTILLLRKKGSFHLKISLNGYLET
ncbi:hypothetical protein Tco_0274703, partial [Tanacetum coccineum]